MRRTFFVLGRFPDLPLAAHTPNHRPMPKRKSLEMLEEFRSCHHFSGLSNAACRIGIPYRDVRVEHASMKGKIASIPCFPDEPIKLECPSFRYSTPEEIREDRRQTQEALRKIDRGLSPCCDAALVPVGGGWEACSACKEEVMHRYRSPEERV